MFMENWRPLDRIENKSVWNFVYEFLQFDSEAAKPNKVKLPIPNRCYDISKYYNGGFDENLYEDLHDVLRKTFETIALGKRMYALDWQHDCYSFDPLIEFEKNEFNEWLVP